MPTAAKRRLSLATPFAVPWLSSPRCCNGSQGELCSTCTASAKSDQTVDYFGQRPPKSPSSGYRCFRRLLLPPPRSECSSSYKASGKTSFVNVMGNGQVRYSLFRSIGRLIGSPQWSEDTVPTVAFHFRKVRKGNVTLKIWDLAGASPFTVYGLWLIGRYL